MDYAYATLPHDSTGFALIEGYLPRASFDWNRATDLQTVREKLSLKKASNTSNAWNKHGKSPAKTSREPNSQ
jgi:hypothetical protein